MSGSDCCSDTGSDSYSNDYTESSSLGSSTESRHRRIRQIPQIPQTLQPGIYANLPPGAIQIPNYSLAPQPMGVTAPAQNGLVLTAPLNPVSNLQGLWSQSDGAIKVFVQRRGGVVTMQWETFSGIIGAEGLKHIVMNLSFSGMPITPITELIAVEYRGVVKTGYVHINPYIKEVIQFHHDFTEQTLSKVGDRILVYGKAISWVAKDAVRTY